MTLRIDSHQHFWRPARGDYRWLRADVPAIAPLVRDFLPQDLAPILAIALPRGSEADRGAGIRGVELARGSGRRPPTSECGIHEHEGQGPESWNDPPEPRDGSRPS